MTTQKQLYGVEIELASGTWDFYGHDEHGDRLWFESIEAAREDLECHIASVRESVERGDMADNYTGQRFRITTLADAEPVLTLEVVQGDNDGTSVVGY